jgi:molybdopterin/thiamine biosynthesis adenylyltransferase
VPGHIGLVQATEAAKLILGIGKPMIGKFYIYNALNLSASFIEIGKRPGCDLCGDNPRITALIGKGSTTYGESSCDPGY